MKRQRAINLIHTAINFFRALLFRMVSSFALIDCMIMQRSRAAWKACIFLCVPESVLDETS